jgi:hypothetical protein
MLGRPFNGITRVCVDHSPYWPEAKSQAIKKAMKTIALMCISRTPQGEDEIDCRLFHMLFVFIPYSPLLFICTLLAQLFISEKFFLLNVNTDG